MKKRLFVDMDGTIARFYEHEQYLEKMFEDGFFRSLRSYRRVILGLQKFSKKHPDIEIFVLSACVTDKSRVEKAEWLAEHYPIPAANHIFMKTGESKSAFVPGGITGEDYLLDDYNKNLLDWAEAGGPAIKIRNEINCRTGSWKGSKISAFDSSDHIANELEKILGLN